MLTIRISPLRDMEEADCSAPDTKRIQEAVDTCHAQGGGKVVLEAGIYVTGTIRLNSHVTLCR